MSGELATQLRIASAIPIAVAAAQAVRHGRAKQLVHMLWVCNVATVALAAGLILAWPPLIRITALLIVLGFLLWIFDVLVRRDAPVSTVLMHCSGLLVSLWAFSVLGATPYLWIVAALGIQGMHLISRLCTPPALNVNAAFKCWPPWDRFFARYWTYWLFNVSSLTALLFGLNGLAVWLFPAPPLDAQVYLWS
jgi:hypothetical protein